MSKIGKINISIPEKVKVALAGSILNIEGPLGKSSIDIDLEINRLSKRIDKLKKHILVSEKKLSNKNFVANAPENIITHEKEKMVQLKLEKELLKKNLKMIS